MADVFLLFGIVLVLLFLGYIIKISIAEIAKGFSSLREML